MKVIPNPDRIGADGSQHFSMLSEKGYVEFAILDGELSAYQWEAYGEGRLFLKELEQYASEHNLKLTIPTMLNPRLQTILEQNGYKMKEVPYFDDVCELWSKEA
jgi:hypothetical protein